MKSSKRLYRKSKWIWTFENKNKTLELNEIAELRQGRFHPFPVVGDSRENSWFRDFGSAAAERVDAVKVVWPVVPRTEKWSSGITLNKNRHFERWRSILTAQGALPMAPAHIIQLLIVHPRQLKSLHCSFETRGIETCFKTSAWPVFLVSPQPRVMQSCDMIGIANGSGIEAMSTVLLKSIQLTPAQEKTYLPHLNRFSKPYKCNVIESRIPFRLAVFPVTMNWLNIMCLFAFFHLPVYFLRLSELDH